MEKNISVTQKKLYILDLLKMLNYWLSCSEKCISNSNAYKNNYEIDGKDKQLCQKFWQTAANFLFGTCYQELNCEYGHQKTKLRAATSSIN